MRKAAKEKVLEFISSLHQAHEEIGGALGRRDYESARKMLGECQEFVISLGESIEAEEGEGHATVACVEEYCEALFRAFEELGGQIQPNGISKMINRRLVKLENSAKRDIVARKEVVFFPYKASMWDSLESVYLAAKEDPECDVYCVPIPYYDRNPDGSFGQMHYEGGEYPERIEIIDWRSYKFEEEKPDQIYIHNAYDNINAVTSVHPRFYSDNLKRYTDLLVYIPYFILGEIEPDVQAAVDGMKHFVFLPGVIHADKVIVQSEKMKQIYVNEYLKAAREYGLRGQHTDRRYLEQKFLGLGSPKVDKVLHAGGEEMTIPADWLKVLQKKDGGRKKVIFYNTGIAALLSHNEKWLDKIEDALKVFKEEQEEVTLLWRPHPLIENTLSSMRAGLLQRYLEIKEQYIREGWGIYDDTADLDRAIGLSDAYYGDGSSVVHLFREIGKPVMIQNVEVLTGK